jgi:NTE family protein
MTPSPSIALYLKPYKTVALVLQGGGALGAYQAGVFEGLSEAGIAPDWIAGVSIGAINGAIIAGNTPGQRLDRLRDFWETVSSSSLWSDMLGADALRGWRNQSSAFMTMSAGLPGFFKPKTPNLFSLNPFALFSGTQKETSYYDTAELKGTLNRLIDWKVLNNQSTRLSVGAVDVETGNSVYFDTKSEGNTLKQEKLRAEHIMASGALPPALPAITIGKSRYWDGGIVSNTPLQYLLERDDLDDMLAFQVDLFSARGHLPATLAEVASRQKDITYSSRTRNSTDTFKRAYSLRLKLREALSRVRMSDLTPADHKDIAALSDLPQINLLHLIYQQKSYEDHAKDYEFSRRSMQDHWAAGLADTRKTLLHPKWLEIPSETTGMVVHDVHCDDPP